MQGGLVGAQMSPAGGLVHGVMEVLGQLRRLDHLAIVLFGHFSIPLNGQSSCTFTTVFEKCLVISTLSLRVPKSVSLKFFPGRP